MAGLDVETMAILSVQEIRHLLQGKISFPRAVLLRRETLIQFLLDSSDPTVHALIHSAADAKRTKRSSEKEKRLTDRKRKREEEQQARRTVPRLDDLTDDNRDTSKFLELPSIEQVRYCYRQFYAATSNAAVATTVCGVCARELLLADNRMQFLRIHDIPHSERLIPVYSHPEHDLFDGKLLEPE
ncbi:hypothetical protein JOM56_015230 [Amanita muscaria]